MKLGFTGTSRHVTQEQKKSLRRLASKLRPAEVHHGDCVEADAAMHEIAVALGAAVVVHPPTNTSKSIKTRDARRVTVRRPKPYLDRNRDIVNETDQLVAAPGDMEERLRSGTWSTVRYARKVGKPVTIVWPDGAVMEEAVRM